MEKSPCAPSPNFNKSENFYKEISCHINSIIIQIWFISDTKLSHRNFEDIIYFNLKQDKDFGKQIEIVAHQNPPAKVSTSLKTYMKYSLDNAYIGQNFFWSMNPVKDDYILFEFDKPTTLYK